MEHLAYNATPLSLRFTSLFDRESWRDVQAHSDLRIAEGQIDNRPFMVIATDPAATMGTIGIAECADFRTAIQRARSMRTPIIMLIDSAGTRLTAGLAVQGAIRQLFREMVDASLGRLPMLAVVGRNAFGSASMLAYTAQTRIYSPATLLAMSGPRALQASVPEADNAPDVSVRINGLARSVVNTDDILVADDLCAYVEAIRKWTEAPMAIDMTHDTLMQYRNQMHGRIAGETSHAEARQNIVVDGSTIRCTISRSFGPADAVVLSDLVESACTSNPNIRLTLEVDCPGHSTLLADEEPILSQYLSYLALSLRYHVRHGASLHLTIAGVLSGGIYISLAGAATTVELAPAASIRTLPAATLEKILGNDKVEIVDRASYVNWGLVDSLGKASAEQIQSPFSSQIETTTMEHAADTESKKTNPLFPVVAMPDTVFVTGGSRGLGEAVVREVHGLGCNVCFSYLSNADRANMLIEELGGERIMAVQADARDFNAMTAAVNQCMQRFGGLDALVNNAGVTRDKSVMSMGLEEWREVIGSNLDGPFHGCKAVISNFLRQRRGNIVNIASVAGMMGVAGQSNYCSSKAGLIGLTRSLALECASRGIRINAVAPGYIETDMTLSLSERQSEYALGRIPMGRFGKPIDIARMVSFLLSDATSYVTGQVFVVDGGLLA